MYTPYGLPVNLLDLAMYNMGPFNLHVPSIPTQAGIIISVRQPTCELSRI